MTRRKWRWNEDLADLEEVSDGTQDVTGFHFVQKEIEPFKAVDGTVINSRRKRSEYMAKNGLVPFEKETRRKPRDDKRARIQALSDAFEKCRDEHYARTRR